MPLIEESRPGTLVQASVSNHKRQASLNNPKGSYLYGSHEGTMASKRVPVVAAWIIAATISPSVAAFGIYGSRITRKIRAPAHSDDWNTFADGGSNSRPTNHE